jgi:hypothetical protein
VSNVFQKWPQIRDEVFLARRPTAARTSYARSGRVEAFLFIKLAIQNHGRFGGVIQEGAQDPVV